MLKNIHIKNIALIEEADIDLDNGLNIMTGETGSGKSIMISSVNIALGEKANKGLIRRQCSQGMVELTFTGISDQIVSAMDEMDIPCEDGVLTITRKITQDSSICRINGESIPLSNLKKITSLLVDIHGQHDHQSLLDPARHIDILDRFGGRQISVIKSSLKDKYDSYRALRKEAREYALNEDELSKETELIEYEMHEIEEASLIPGEDDALEADYKRLEKFKEASESLQSAYIALSDEESGAASKVSKTLSEITFALKTLENDSDLQMIKNTVTDMDSVIRDLQHDLDKFIERNSFDSEHFVKVRDRLNLINRLKSRYGRSVDDILGYYDDLVQKLKKYSDYNSTRSKLNEELVAGRAELNRLAGVLSAARKKAASELEPMIISNLRDLNFLEVNFSIDFKKAEKITDNGFDRMEFLISMNPGEKLMPLSRVASGGELSRIMLAIKSSVADNDDIPTLIFDEIDTGISGKTAQMVAHKLYDLSRSHQVICITHLPQIAAMADSHFSIRKEVSDGTTISGTEKLDDNAQIMDIARLLGGMDITQASLNNAADLKAQAAAYKTGSEHSDNTNNFS